MRWKAVGGSHVLSVGSVVRQLHLAHIASYGLDWEVGLLVAPTSFGLLWNKTTPGMVFMTVFAVNIPRYKVQVLVNECVPGQWVNVAQMLSMNGVAG